MAVTLDVIQDDGSVLSLQTVEQSIVVNSAPPPTVQVLGPTQTPIAIDITTGGKGDKGDPGQSAYQIAVFNGFSGTQQQWLDSLKGTSGTPVDPKVRYATTYGALGDNSTDDTVALQNALNACGPGDVLVIPGGRYRISASLKPKPLTTIVGAGALRAHATFSTLVSVIKPFTGMTGKGIIEIQDKVTAGYTDESESITIRDITLDGSALGATVVSGIYSEGFVHSVTLRNINISYASDRGIFTRAASSGLNSGKFPYSWVLDNVQIHASGFDGLRLSQMTDAVISNVRANASGRHGFYLDGMANATLTNVRAEWSGQHGFYFTSSWGTGSGSGGATITNITTDRNGNDGIRIDATGSHPLHFGTVTCRRDGYNGGIGGGGWSGVNVTFATMPVIISSLSVTSGVDDTGTSTPSPETGLRVSGSDNVQVNAGYVWGVTNHIVDGGSNTSFLVNSTVTKVTGIPGSKVVTAGSVSAGLSQAAVDATVLTKVGKRPITSAQTKNIRWQQRFDSGHGWTTGGALGSITNPVSSAAHTGTNIVNLVTNTVGGVGTFTGTGQTSVNLTTRAQVRAWIKTNNQQQIGTFTLRASDTGGIAAGRYAEWSICNSLTQTLGANQMEIPFGNVLVPIQMSPADAVLTGTPDLTAITEWQFTLADRNNGQAAQTMTIDTLEVVDAGLPQLGANGVLLLTFDDSYANQYTVARQVLNKYGFAGTFMTIVDALGSSGTFMTVSQLRELQRDGHEIATHSYAKSVHDNIATTSQANAELDFKTASQWMVDNGFGGASMAYPNGYFYTTGDPAREIFDCARTTLGNFSHNATPMLDTYRVRSITKVGGSGTGSYATTNLTATNGVLDKAASNNTAVNLTFHEVVSGAAAAVLQCSAADLDAICAKAKALGMSVVTMTQFSQANSSIAGASTDLSNYYTKTQTDSAITTATGAITKTSLGLGLVPNVDATARSSHTGTQTASTISDFTTATDARITAQKGQLNGLASLDGGGRVPAAQLPAYVDDALEYANLAAFPAPGSTGIIYVALDSNKTYRWSGTSYIQINQSEVTSVSGRVGAIILTSSDVGLSLVPNVDARARSTHTGTQSADTLTDGTTNKAFLATERTKLTGVAAGATVNSADSFLLSRANHTGTQAISTVTGLQAALDLKSAYTDVQKSEAIVRWDGVTGSQPLRSSVTADTSRPVCWRQPNQPPTTTGYAIAGLDTWQAVSA